MRESWREATVRRILLSIPLLASLLALVVMIFGGPFKGYEGDAALVVVPRGSTPAQVATLLADAGIIRSRTLFQLEARLSGKAPSLQAGEYRFEGPLSSWTVLGIIASGEVLLHKLTIPEGLTGMEVISRVAGMGLAGKDDLLAAFRDPSPVHDIDPRAVDLEGYLFPDTYHFARPTPARQILGDMVARFRDELADGLAEQARRAGMSIHDMVTLASLIEKETSLPEERGRISAVFHNRLERRMPLQCDPTVIYALASDGRYNGSLTREDLQYVSPYNTYVNPGLPPGPIAAPGRAALEAAIQPDDAPDLYFVADGSGGHHFSRTLEEHLRAVEKYRRLQRSGA